MKMYKQKRLHPIAILIKLGENIKISIIPIAISLFTVFRNYLFIVLIALLLINLFAAILSWLTHTYQLDEKEIRIKHGIIFRHKRYIPYERIQSIDISEGLLQRIFRLVTVQIETAGGNHHEGAEALLSEISKKEAQYIQDAFMAGKKSSSPPPEEEDKQTARQVYQITAKQLLILSLTSGGVGVVISAVLAFLSHTNDFIPYKKLFGESEKAATGNIIFFVVILLFALLILWIISLIMVMLKYANFTVKKTETDLMITKGLLEKRQLTIPLNRIQMVLVSENILRQLFGLATVYIESAGGSHKNLEDAKVMMIPIMKREHIAAVIQPFLTDYKFITAFDPVPKRALRRYVLRSWYLAIPIVMVSLLFFKLWGLLSLLLLAAATLLAYLKYRDAGWHFENRQLSFRYRKINRDTVFILKNRIQSLNVSESYFQRRKELVTVEAFVKTGTGHLGGKITDLGNNEAQKIYGWFLAKK